ncbi:MAG: hypothetical protein JWL96_2432 [Sphingomonas bacterium]|uniref:hypothetical protein n=1 Tax=Sphingomonas bacterium TaxID=1895847 RepID=UPI00262FE61F|nr:hypothetical protein [Sphingomonas bacterium]MDB5710362.1 hypothetical protein [Sphingomonas bacterium]
MRDKFIAKQASFRANDMRKLINFNRHSGLELYDSYKRNGIFHTHETDVAAAIGIQALDAITKAGISEGLVQGYLSEIVIDGLVSLAMKAELWQSLGAPESVARCRSWISEGSDQARKRRIQELLGVQERRSNRFLLLSGDREPTTTDDIAKLYARADEPLRTIVDALALAKRVEALGTGALFTLELEQMT